MAKEAMKREMTVTPFLQAMSSQISAEQAEAWAKGFFAPYRELMTYYHCAMMEVETKFKVLNEDFSIKSNRNPIESIETRLKTPDSIVGKMLRNKFPITVESIEENLNDVAGIRVICSFQSDIYRLADALLNQDDVTLLRTKDYIKKPKKNGYRSLHLIIAVPIFLRDEKRMMKVEVQLRTLAMNVWASLEHKIKYKNYSAVIQDDISEKLLHCADMTAELDREMESILAKMNDVDSKELF